MVSLVFNENFSLYVNTWNIFGTGKPEATSQISIICQINSPVDGIDRRMNGAFAKGGNGEIFVIHRGRLTGKGMTKSFFKANYRGKWIDIQDGKKKNRVVLIGSLNSPDFCEKVRDFVFEAERIKGLAA